MPYNSVSAMVACACAYICSWPRAFGHEAAAILLSDQVLHAGFDLIGIFAALMGIPVSQKSEQHHRRCGRAIFMIPSPKGPCMLQLPFFCWLRLSHSQPQGDGVFGLFRAAINRQQRFPHRSGATVEHWFGNMDLDLPTPIPDGEESSSSSGSTTSKISATSVSKGVSSVVSSSEMSTSDSIANSANSTARPGRPGQRSAALWSRLSGGRGDQCQDQEQRQVDDRADQPGRRSLDDFIGQVLFLLFVVCCLRRRRLSMSGCDRGRSLAAFFASARRWIESSSPRRRRPLADPTPPPLVAAEISGPGLTGGKVERAGGGGGTDWWMGAVDGGEVFTGVGGGDAPLPSFSGSATGNGSATGSKSTSPGGSDGDPPRG